MLFMGEEWGASSPFQFFSSHPEPELAEATRAGRKAEFAEHGWDADEIPDPQDPRTFQRSKLDWAEIDSGEHPRLLKLYRDLISLRRSEADLADSCLDHLVVEYDEAQRWIVLRRNRLAIVCNLGSQAVTVPVHGELVLAWDPPEIGDEASQVPAQSFAILRCG
jgi:maltooligosyltrehalose trehalohydrolase